MSKGRPYNIHHRSQGTGNGCHRSAVRWEQWVWNPVTTWAGYGAKVWRPGQRTPSWCSLLRIHKTPKGHSALQLERHILHSPKPQTLIGPHREQSLPLWWPRHPAQGSLPHPGPRLLWSPSLVQSGASRHREVSAPQEPQHQSWWKGPSSGSSGPATLFQGHPRAHGVGLRPARPWVCRTRVTHGRFAVGEAPQPEEPCSDGRPGPVVGQGTARLTQHHLHTFPVSQISTAGTPAAMGRHFSSEKRHGRL